MTIPATSLLAGLAPGAAPGRASADGTDSPSFTAFMATAGADAVGLEGVPQLVPGTPPVDGQGNGAGDVEAMLVSASATAFLQASAMSALAALPGNGQGGARGASEIAASSLSRPAVVGVTLAQALAGIPFPALQSPAGDVLASAGGGDPAGGNSPAGGPPQTTPVTTPVGPANIPVDVPHPGGVATVALAAVSGLAAGDTPAAVSGLAAGDTPAAGTVASQVLSHTNANAAATPNPAAAEGKAATPAAASDGEGRSAPTVTPTDRDATPRALPTLPMGARVSLVTDRAPAALLPHAPLASDVAFAATAATSATAPLTTPRPTATTAKPATANGPKAGNGAPAAAQSPNAAAAGQPPAFSQAQEHARVSFVEALQHPGQPQGPSAASGRPVVPQGFAEARGEPTPLGSQQPAATAPALNGSFEAALRAERHDGAARPPAEQVALRIRTALKQGVDRIIIQLKPASLGKIEIKLDVASDGRVAAVVTVDRPETLELLQRDARGLERALQEAGLRTDSGSLSFNLRGEGRFDDDGAEAHSNAGAEATADETGIDPAPAEPTPPAASDRALDIQV